MKKIEVRDSGRLKSPAGTEAKRPGSGAVERVKAKYPDYVPPVHELAAVRAFAIQQGAGR